MKFSIKQAKLIAVFFFVLLYAAFYVYKITKYDLFYYQHDIFSTVTESVGWKFGHPLLWDNRFGIYSAIHFSLIGPLFAPFVLLAGGKGLFIAHTLIFFIAFSCALYKISDKTILIKRVIVLTVFLLSPYAFWLFDDTNYGWHFELLFVPISLLFALTLIAKKRWLAWLCTLLLAITKEDGSVIACCIALIYVLSENDGYINWKKIWKTILFWGMIFLVSMFLIKLSGGFRESRVEITLREFQEDTRFFNAGYFQKISWQFIVMVFPLIVFGFLFLSNRDFLKLLLCCIPVIIIGIIAGLWYSGNAWFSLVWVTRFAEIMGVLLAGIFIFMNNQKQIESYKQKFHNLSTVLIIMGFQVVALIVVRDYNLFTEIKKAYTHTLYETVTTADVCVIRCIAEKTPDDFNVAVPYEYFSAFDKNDLTWFDHPQVAPQKNPDLIILDDSSKFAEYKFDYDQYQSEKKGKFYVLVKKGKILLNKDCN